MILIFLFWGFLLVLLFYILKNRLAIFWPSTKNMIAIIMDLADIGKTDRVYDLGSGDGRVVEKLATKAKKVVGVEHSKFLNSIARKRTAHLKNASILDANLFDVDLSDADAIVAYLSRPVTYRLEKKIIEECKKGTRVILVGYKFRKLKLLKEKRTFLMKIRLYAV